MAKHGTEMDQDHDMRVDPVRYEDLEDKELREMFANFPRNQGPGENSLPTHYQIEANLPQVMKPMLRTFLAVNWEGPLSEELVSKLRIAVSMANNCEYCTGVFCTLMAGEGDSAEAVQTFQETVLDGDFGEREGELIDFAMTLTNDPHAITEKDFSRLRDNYGVTDEEFVHLAYVVNVISAYNRITTAFDADFEDVYHDNEWLL